MGEPEDVGSEECWSCRKQRVLSSMGAGGGGGEILKCAANGSWEGSSMPAEALIECWLLWLQRMLTL